MSNFFTIRKLCLWFFFLFNLSNLIAQNGAITGRVLDNVSKEPLIGANVIITGSNRGSATDIEGKFQISNIPPGKYILKASYLGYMPNSVEVEVFQNKTVSLVLPLDFVIVEGEEILVTGQAEAQLSAINQQLSAQSIKNIVSAKKIQEIPDANAAEALGRLPGVSLLRSGGEGSKVVVRGLAPKFNKIQIEGVSMSSTGSDDRSTDLSMISPYMLEGIELSKAALADQEADVIGGSINFILREAPKDFHFDVVAQSGYNGLKKEFGDYKFVLSGSNRFFENKLGIFAQLDIENRNRSSYELAANYTNYSSPSDPREVDVSIGNLMLKDIIRDIERIGGTIVLDYKLPEGKIKLSNFISSIGKNTTNRFDNLRPFLVDRFYTLEKLENDLTVMTNNLRIDNNLFGGKIDVGISYSFAENKLPSDMIFQGYNPDAFDKTKLNYQVSPEKLMTFTLDDLNTAYLYDVTLGSAYTKETNFAADINFQYKINFYENFSSLIKVGTKYKHLYKNYDKEVEWMPIHWGGGEPSKRIDLILQHYPWMQKTAPLGSLRLPYKLFVDQNYNPEDFLGGNYLIKNMPNADLANEISDLLKGNYFYNYHESIKDDYNGFEDYYAMYVMTELKLGEEITFIPGVRYENKFTSYKGIRGNAQTILEQIGYSHSDTTTERSNEFWLPMIHLKYKPFTWFDIRLAYTETLARPNFNQIVPSWNRTLTTVYWNNPYLKPSHSMNYDMYASFYNNELGLLTVGGFYKKINDLIFSAGLGAIIDASEYGLPATENGKTISKVINNKFPAELYGLEIEWQTNFWYLPGIFKNFVLNINYTHTYSDAKYPRTIIKTEYLNQAPWVQTVNIDTFYNDRLLYQPNNIFNITIGFDYKGFSSRISMLFQDDIFKHDNFWERLRGTSDKFTRWDITLRQSLLWDGLEAIANFNNITSSIEKDIISGTKGTMNEQHYGFTLDLGLRYRL